MASTASQHDTARAPPPPDQLASFHSLVNKYVNASVLCRHARAVELSAKAAAEGEALFGRNSLVVAQLRMAESFALTDQSINTSDAEREALVRRSLRVLLVVIPILQCHLADNTLLPGTIRKEEIEYYAHKIATTLAATKQEVPSPAELQILGSTIGYDVLLDALFKSLNFLNLVFAPLWPEAQRKVVESFVRALLLLSSPSVTDACHGGVAFFRFMKPWTSFLAQPVLNDEREKTLFRSYSKNT